MTLNDCTALYCTNDASFVAHWKFPKKLTHTISGKNVAQGLYFQTVGPIRYMQIYTWGFHGEGATNYRGVGRTSDFFIISVTTSPEPLELKPI